MQQPIPLYVITTAYRASEYIWQFLPFAINELKSIRNAEIYIGIDACEQTLAEVEKIKNYYPDLKNVSFFYSTENVGTYVMKNSLLMQLPEENHLLLFFDIDDILTPGYIVKYYNICLRLIEYNNNMFLFRTMHLPIRDSIIRDAFTHRIELGKPQEIIQRLIERKCFAEAISYLLHFSMEQYSATLSELWEHNFNIASLESEFMRAAKLDNAPQYFDMIVKALQKNYKSSHICMLISCLAKLYYMHTRHYDNVRQGKFLPIQSWGVFFTTSACMKRLGFFNRYRVDQDNDILKRAKAMGISVLGQEDLPFFVRRISSTSLTQLKGTGYTSPYRLRVRSVNDRLIARKQLVARGISRPLIKL